MSKHRSAAAALVVALSAALAGCSAGNAAGAPAAPAAQPLSLTMSLATPAATWAVVRTGGREAGGKFWQLLVRPQASSTWRLVTPPGVADDGGLAIATEGSSGLVVGFLPSQLLKFTPRAITTDGGAHWSQGLLPASLTPSPGALAALPDSRLLAATSKGVEESARAATGWSLLVSLRTLAATPAGRECGLVRLTAVAAVSSGAVLAGGQCARRGIAVVFEQAAGGWQSATLKLTKALGRQPAEVVRLTGAAPSAPSVLLAIGAGKAQTLLAASLSPSGAKLSEWGRTDLPASAGPSFFFASSGSWGVVASNRAQYEVTTGTSGFSYNAAPVPLPRAGGMAAFGTGQPGRDILAQTQMYALVPGLDAVAVWHEDNSDNWRKTQVIGIPPATG